MIETDLTMESRWLVLVEAGVAGVGMCLFALFFHIALPFKALSPCGLLLTSFAIFRGLKSEPFPAVVLGVNLFSPVVAVYTAFGLLIGVALGMVDRLAYGLGSQFAAFGWFAPVAAAIGATEEILYRGYIQGRMRSFGLFSAIIFASLCHTAYKLGLFVFTPLPMEIDFGLFALCTFTGGLAFGALRQFAGSIWPPLTAHACFDIIVYGQCSHAPWWVWS